MTRRFLRMLDPSDREFMDAHAKLRNRAVSGVTTAEITAAADVLVQYARRSKGDPLAWGFVLAVYSDFVAAGEPPPMPILAALGEVFDRIRGGMGWEDAIRGERAGRGRPSATLLQRGLSRTNAGIVEDFIARGLTKTEAVERTARLRGYPRKRGQHGAVSPSAVEKDHAVWKRANPKKRKR